MGIFNIFNRLRKDDGRRRYLDRLPLTIPYATHGIDRRQIDANAIRVVRRLQEGGYRAYLVGGCVRDFLIGRTPKDYDVVTNAVPAEIKDLYPRARIIGRRFRIVHVPFGLQVIETATFRALPKPGEDEGEDMLIKRDNIYGSEPEDAARRDFTINALFYDPVSEKIVDYVDGYADIKRGVIRIIGNPRVSYQEDPVRMIRAVKFQATTGFRMERDTLTAIRQLAGQIRKCSTARVMEEIYKIMRSGVAARVFASMAETGLLHHLMPEVDKRVQADNRRNGGFPSSPLGQRLGMLDELVRKGRSYSNVVFLAVLFYDLLADLQENAAPQDVGSASHDFLADLAKHMGFSRRDKDLLIRAITTQSRFESPARKSPGFVARFAGRDFFRDSLDFYEIRCLMKKTGQAELAFWKDAAKRHALAALPSGRRTSPERPPRRDPRPAPPPAAIQEETAPADPARKKRRRRGGRKRRRPDQAGNAAPS